MLHALKYVMERYFSVKGNVSRAPLSHFRILATIGHEAATALFEQITTQSDERMVIENLEHSGDHEVAECHRYLDTTFIPLYDKEDVRDLAHRLDDVIDEIKKALSATQIYGLTDLTFAVAMATIIERSTKILCTIIFSMPSFNREMLRTGLEEIATLEADADRLFKTTLTTIFGNIGLDSSVTKRMLGIENVLHRLERVTDACKHAGETIDTIARKQGV